MATTIKDIAARTGLGLAIVITGGRYEIEVTE
jgi:hypothetical protein